MTETLKLNTILTLLKTDPQQNSVELFNNLLLILPIDYQVGSKHLSRLSSLPDDNTLENLFNVTSELLVTDVNTIILYSTKPFNIRINLDGNILSNIYHYSYVSADDVDIYISNHSLTDGVDIKYILGNSNLLGNSYVYS